MLRPLGRTRDVGHELYISDALTIVLPFQQAATANALVLALYATYLLALVLPLFEVIKVGKIRTRAVSKVRGTACGVSWIAVVAVILAGLVWAMAKPQSLGINSFLLASGMILSPYPVIVLLAKDKWAMAKPQSLGVNSFMLASGMALSHQTVNMLTAKGRTFKPSKPFKALVWSVFWNWFAITLLLGIVFFLELITPEVDLIFGGTPPQIISEFINIDREISLYLYIPLFLSSFFLVSFLWIISLLSFPFLVLFIFATAYMHFHSIFSIKGRTFVPFKPFISFKALVWLVFWNRFAITFLLGTVFFFVPFKSFKSFKPFIPFKALVWLVFWNWFAITLLLGTVFFLELITPRGELLLGGTPPPIISEFINIDSGIIWSLYSTFYFLSSNYLIIFLWIISLLSLPFLILFILATAYMHFHSIFSINGRLKDIKPLIAFTPILGVLFQYPYLRNGLRAVHWNFQTNISLLSWSAIRFIFEVSVIAVVIGLAAYTDYSSFANSDNGFFSTFVNDFYLDNALIFALLSVPISLILPYMLLTNRLKQILNGSGTAVAAGTAKPTAGETALPV